MKAFPKLTALVVILMLLVVFRGPAFRVLVRYETIGQRPVPALENPALQSWIRAATLHMPLETPAQVMKAALDLTESRLEFSMGRVSNDPNRSLVTGRANCVGYAASVSAIFNFLCRERGLAGETTAIHHIGRLRLLGVDVHQFLDGPFWRDHDFNEIMDRNTGSRYFVDGSLSDFSGIRQIALWKP